MAIESLKTKLRRLLVKGFYSIQSSSGYNHDIALVKEMLTDYENIPEVPMINIFPIGEMYAAAGGGQNGQFTFGMQEKIVVFSVDFIAKATDDPLLVQEQMVSDMETYFGKYYMIPDLEMPSEYGCRESIIVSNQNFGLATNQNLIGVTFRIHCYLGQNLQNPGVR